MARHDIKVTLTREQELEKLIRAQRADDRSHFVRRQRFTDHSGQRAYTQPLEAIPFWVTETEWNDPTFEAACHRENLSE